MRCRCGNEITHVPEHLEGLANWVCHQCSNMAPRANPRTISEESAAKKASIERKKKAA